MKAMPKEVKKESRIALKVGADELTGAMKSLVPVVSGDLKSSIRHYENSTTDRLSWRVTAGNNTTVPYARIVEFKYKRGFFWPVYRALRRRVRSRITRHVNKGIKQTVAKNKKN